MNHEDPIVASVKRDEAIAAFFNALAELIRAIMPLVAQEVEVRANKREPR